MCTIINIYLESYPATRIDYKDGYGRATAEESSTRELPGYRAPANSYTDSDEGKAMISVTANVAGLH